MYKVTANDRRLIEEFRAKPIGHHSPELQRLLHAFRAAPLAGKYVLICTKPGREWTLGRLSGVRGQPVQVLHNHVYHAIEEAERAVFRLRWQEATGEDLDGGEGPA